MPGPLASQIPAETREWLAGDDNPGVAVLVRRHLFGEAWLRGLPG